MKTFSLWLLQVSVPTAFAICLLLLFPWLLENTVLVVLSYCLGVFFLLMAAFITCSYLLSAKHQAADLRTDLGGRDDMA
jgi:hypothetical protein